MFSLVAGTGLFVKIGLYTFGTMFKGMYVCFPILKVLTPDFYLGTIGVLIDFVLFILLTGTYVTSSLTIGVTVLFERGT